MDVIIRIRLRNAEKRRKIQSHRQHLRELRLRSNPFKLPDERFIKLFRLGKTTARLLIRNLQPIAEDSGIPFVIKVLTALHFYGEGSYQTSIGSSHQLGLSQPSVSKSIQEITKLINLNLQKRLIRFPRSILHMATSKERFHRKFGITRILGAIDGCHVAIKAPPDSDPIFRGNLYHNRKGYHSLNVLMCCDADMKILYADARFPGSVHDSAIWQVSPLRTFLKERFTTAQNQNEFLAGDSGFPLEPWLLTPFESTTENSQEKIYNEKFIRTRNIIEKCFGVLKARFRCLLRRRTLHYDPTTSGKIIYACCSLHNMCMDSPIDNEINLDDDAEYLEDDEAEIEDNEIEDTAPTEWRNLGVRVRQRYAEEI